VSNEELQMSMSILLSRLPYLLTPYPYENLWCKLFALGNNLPALRRLLGCNPSTGTGTLFPPPSGTTGTGTNNASPLLLCEHSANEVEDAVLLQESGTSKNRRSTDDDDDNSAETTTGGINFTTATTAATNTGTSTSTSTSNLAMVVAESFYGGSALEPVPGTVLAALCALRAAAMPGTAADPPHGTDTGMRNRTLYLGAAVHHAMIVSSDSYSDSGIAESPRASHQHHHHRSSSSPGGVVVSVGGHKKQKQYRYDEK
jgi:hypothetical protein